MVGQYPRKRTGSLQRGIYCNLESSDRIAKSRSKSVTIGYEMKASKAGKRPYLYGPHLVNNMARKGIFNTFYSKSTMILAPARRWKPVVMIQLRGG
jgi:hypothetical protein